MGRDKDLQGPDHSEKAHLRRQLALQEIVRLGDCRPSSSPHRFCHRFAAATYLIDVDDQPIHRLPFERLHHYRRISTFEPRKSGRGEEFALSY